MKTINIGNTGMAVSLLSLGTWGMGGGTAWQGSDDAESIKVMHRALELGINFIDTAPVYGTGHSEDLVGRALKGRRQDCILSTKCTLNWREERGVKQYDRDGKSVYRCFEAASLKQDLEDSLKRIGTDYIDIYFTHRQPDDISAISEVYGVLDDFKRQGRIRAIGISNCGTEHLNEYLKCGPVEMVQEKFSLLDAADKKELLSLCEKNNIVYQGFSTLERGLLAGRIGMDYEIQKGEARSSIPWMDKNKRMHILEMLKKWDALCKKHKCSIASLVIAYTIKFSSCLNILFGTSRLESLNDTVSSLEINLDEGDLAKMKEDICIALKACAV